MSDAGMSDGSEAVTKRDDSLELHERLSGVEVQPARAGQMSAFSKLDMAPIAKAAAVQMSAFSKLPLEPVLKAAAALAYADMANEGLSSIGAFPRVAPSVFACRFDSVETLSGAAVGNAFISNDQARIDRIATQIVATTLVCLVMVDMYLSRRELFDLVLNVLGTLGVVANVPAIAGRVFDRLTGISGPGDGQGEPPTR